VDESIKAQYVADTFLGQERGVVNQGVRGNDIEFAFILVKPYAKFFGGKGLSGSD